MNKNGSVKTVLHLFTLKALGCQPSAPPLSETSLCKIYGRIDSYTGYESDKGSYVKFRGVFEAITPKGAEFTGNVMALPFAIQDHLQAKFDAMKGSTEFAIEVSVVPLESSPVGYAYAFNDLMYDPSKDDSLLKSLRSKYIK